MANSEHNWLGEGATVGVIGAMTVAGWFLVMDLIHGAPFFTPNVLGQVILFGRQTPELTLVPESIALYSFVHFAAFIGFGILITQLVHLAVRESTFRFALLLLFVIFEVFFYGFTYIFFAGTRGVVLWWSILVANTLAAIAMGLYIWLRHPSLRQSPDHEPLGAETT